MSNYPTTWNAIERFQMWLDNGCANGNGESPEQQELFEDDLRSILQLARITMIIEPMLRGHLHQLRMDTPEDEALRLGMIETCRSWYNACEAVRSVS